MPSVSVALSATGMDWNRWLESSHLLASRTWRDPPDICSDRLDMIADSDGAARFVGMANEREKTNGVCDVIVKHGLREKFIESGCRVLNRLSWRKSVIDTVSEFRGLTVSPEVAKLA